MRRLINRIKPQPTTESWEDYFHGRETLLWEGHPAEGIKGSFGMIGLSIFGVPFLAAGLGVFGMAIAAMFSGERLAAFGGGLFMMFFSLPFIGAGVGLVFGTWFVSYYSSHFVRYAITNKRAYIAKSWWQHTMESYPIKADNNIELQQGRFDTVYFFTEVTTDSDGDLQRNKIGFENIANGMDVYKLLRDVQAKAAEKYGTEPQT